MKPNIFDYVETLTQVTGFIYKIGVSGGKYVIPIDKKFDLCYKFAFISSQKTTLLLK